MDDAHGSDRPAGRRQVTDPRPVPSPSVWGLLLAVVVPALYLLWVRVAIPVARSGEGVSEPERLSFTVLRMIVQPVAVVAIVLGIIGVVVVRRDPHLYRWQWVGFAAIAIGVTEIAVYVGGWLGWWAPW